MTVRAFIKRTFPLAHEKEVLPLLKELRLAVPRQPGYVTSEHLRRLDRPNEVVVLSTWSTLEAWNAWFAGRERQVIQAKIDSIPGVTTEVAVYTF